MKNILKIDKINPTPKQIIKEFEERFSKVIEKTEYGVIKEGINPEMLDFLEKAYQQGYEEGFKDGLEAGTPMIHNEHR